MGEGEVHRIAKLKGKENWTTYEINIKAVLVDANLWKYTSERVKAPIPPILPTGTITEKIQADYDDAWEAYDIKKEEFEKKHEQAIAKFILSCETDPRTHIAGFENSELAFLKLKKQFDDSYLSTVDISVQEICKCDLNDFASVAAYGTHLKYHYNKIANAEKIISDWFMKFFFRIDFTTKLNSYIFNSCIRLMSMTLISQSMLW